MTPRPAGLRRLAAIASALAGAALSGLAAADGGCPARVPYPPDTVVRQALAPGGGSAPLVPSYQRFLAAQAANRQHDPANLCRFRVENAAQRHAGRPAVVMIGDSITESWLSASPDLRRLGFVSRGISSQTSAEVRARFAQDVIALHPRAVHILVGTNNIAGIGGPFDLARFGGDIAHMIAAAKANGIAVIIGSVLPVRQYPWQPTLDPAPLVARVNEWLTRVARRNDAVFVDYHRTLSSGSGAMPAAITNDGVHPNLVGYRLMHPLLIQAVRTATVRNRRHPSF